MRSRNGSTLPAGSTSARCPVTPTHKVKGGRGGPRRSTVASPAKSAARAGAFTAKCSVRSIADDDRIEITSVVEIEAIVNGAVRWHRSDIHREGGAFVRHPRIAVRRRAVLVSRTVIRLPPEWIAVKCQGVWSSGLQVELQRASVILADVEHAAFMIPWRWVDFTNYLTPLFEKRRYADLNRGH